MSTKKKQWFTKEMQKKCLKSRMIIVFCTCLFVAIFLATYDRDELDVGKKTLSTKDYIREKILASKEIESTKTSPNRKGIDIEQSKNKIENALVNLSDRIRLEYGNYLDELLWNFNESKFSPPEKLEKMFISSSNAKERLMRRMKIKFLRSNFLEEEETFIWSTAGHSAAAAHGNLFNQSYSAMIEDTVKDAFSSVNVNFHAYNNAMGGMNSNPELALCIESVIGPTVDILSWDFGMTDGSKEQQVFGITFWGHRAALHPTRPLLFGFPGGRSNRITEFLGLEGKANMSSFSFDPKKFQVDTFPDSTAKNSSIDSIPPALKYYICSGHVESSDECGKRKYNTKQFCTNTKIKGQVGWHPGWKDHMFIGRIIGLYLLHFLYLSIDDLSEEFTFNTDLNLLLDQLLEEELLEKQQYHAYANNKKNLTKIYPTYQLIKSKSINEILFFKQAICHTAILPSHTRYNNIIFDENNQSKYTTSFLQGISREQFDKDQDSSKQLPLIHNRNEENVCKPKNTNKVIKLDQDFKDYFIVGKQLREVTLPNAQEYKHYYHYPKHYKVRKAAIIMCPATCPWGKCPKGYLKFEDIESYLNQSDVQEKNDVVKLLINGENVSSVKPITNHCFFLGNNNGIAWKCDEDCHIKLSMQVLKDHFLFISSIILQIW